MVCIVLSVLLAIVCNPRVFYGNGAGSAAFSLDDFFFWGQWAAFGLALMAMLMSWPGWIGAGRMITFSALWVPLLSLFAFAFLLVTGVPHRANSARWASGETGVAAFVRGMSLSAKAREQLNPVLTSSAAFAGQWIAADSIIYTFEDRNLSGRVASTGRAAWGSADCGGIFSIRYFQRDREVLQDFGLTWSPHANSVYDATPVNAKIPVAEVTCGSERVVFVRATFNEIWRWTSALTQDDIKSTSYLMKRIEGAR